MMSRIARRQDVSLMFLVRDTGACKMIQILRFTSTLFDVLGKGQISCSGLAPEQRGKSIVDFTQNFV